MWKIEQIFRNKMKLSQSVDSGWMMKQTDRHTDEETRRKSFFNGATSQRETLFIFKFSRQIGVWCVCTLVDQFDGTHMVQQNFNPQISLENVLVLVSEWRKK